MDKDRMFKCLSVATGSPLKDLIYLYQCTEIQNIVFRMDLMQFVSRGVPLLQELAKVMDCSVSDVVNDRCPKGKILFYHLDLALNNLTSEGGKFYRLDKYYTE